MDGPEGGTERSGYVCTHCILFVPGDADEGLIGRGAYCCHDSEVCRPWEYL